MGNNNIDYLNDVLGKIKTKNCILFLGAGASISAGGKSWSKLSVDIKKRFNKISYDSDDFFEICDEICQTYPYNRNELLVYLKDEFEKLKPSKYHDILTKYDWGAIFTTNYDDVIEESYRGNSRLKPCYPYVKSDISYDYGRDKIKLFKLMGCVRYYSEKIENGGLVLTQSDYDYNLATKNKYFDILYDLLKNGTVIFIGYSFADKLVERLLNRVFRDEKLENLPWSYYVSPEDLSEKKDKMLNNKKIKQIKMSFEEFIEYIDKNYDNELANKEEEKLTINIKGENHIIDYEEYIRDYADNLEIMHNEIFNEKEETNMDNFFKGIEKSYIPFKKNWDIKRDIYLYKYKGKKSLKERVISELTDEELSEPRHNSLLVVEGDAGSGKSILLKRIAYDVYNEINIPVLILKNLKSSYDPKLISDLVYTIINKDYKNNGIKILILVDDVGKNLRQVINLKNVLSGMGVSVLFVVSDRSNEIELSLDDTLTVIEEENRYKISDLVDSAEKERLFNHLEILGYIFSKELIDEDIKDYNSFFALVYSLVDPSHQPLEKSVRLQYFNLSPKMQEIYLLIAMFYQFNVSINIEWLLRIIKISYSDFYSRIVNTEGKGIIIEEQDERGNIFFRLHHRIIAEILISTHYIGTEEAKDIFVNAFKVANLNNKTEYNICKRLVYYNFNVKNENCIFEFEQVEEMFMTLGRNNRYRFIYHHWGILETQKGIGSYPEAERLLKEGLKYDEDDDFVGKETASGVLTSLGTLYSKWYTESTDKDIEKLKLAEQCFLEAKNGTKNIHPYHAHANMYYQLGNHAVDDEEKYDYYSKSLSIINKAKNILNDEDLQRILELEVKVLSKINNQTDEVVSILEEKFNSYKGYFIKSLFIYKDGEKEQNLDKINAAYDILKKLYQEGKIDEECLRLQLTIYFKYKIVKFEEVFDMLFKWYNMSDDTDDIFMLYHLGVSAFNLKKYVLSQKIFRRLDKLSNGYKFRSKPNFFIKNGKENELFEGEVISVDYGNNIGFIKCLSLKGYNEVFQFRPYLVKKHSVVSRGNLVEFNIAFNYRGPLALNINKK